MRYWPNPAHKRETTEAGPPRWQPNKAPCPRMTVEERDRLLEESLPERPDDPRSPRFALRRTPQDTEWFEARFTGEEAGDPVFHGYPTCRVPARVLRRFRDRDQITHAEYQRWVRVLG